MRAVMDEPPLDRVRWGILAVDAATGDTLLRHDAGRLAVPASNAKLLVTAAALERLGSGWRYRTVLWSPAPLVGGTLEGDLVLAGSGDPTLSERFWPSAEAALDAMADSLATAGVRAIDGALVVDASAWDTTGVPGTWQTGDLPWPYAAPGGAFAVGEGQTEVVVRGAATPGPPATVTWSPLGEPGFVESRVVTVPPDSTGDVRPGWLPGSRRIVLEGEVPAGGVDTVDVATRDPVGQAAAALGRALAARGIALRGGWRVALRPEAPIEDGCPVADRDACPGARTLAALVSPPLADVVAGILGPSQNWMAEQLLVTLGSQVEGEASREAGLDVVRLFLQDDVGVDSLDLSLHDGSGLSPYDLVTPRALVAVLRYMRGTPEAGVFRSALPEPGEKDSTLEDRLLDLEGRLWAKTGTLSPVNALSGYLVRSDGHEVVFSILVGDSAFPGSLVRGAVDRIVELLAGSR